MNRRKKFCFSQYGIFYPISIFLVLQLIVVIFFTIQKFNNSQNSNFEKNDLNHQNTDDVVIHSNIPTLDEEKFSFIQIPKFSKYPPTPPHNGVNYFRCDNVDENFASHDELKKYLLNPKKNIENDIIDFPSRDLPVGISDSTFWYPMVERNFIKKSNFLLFSKKKYFFAVIVPIRSRCKQLKYTIPYLHNFLQKFAGLYRIIVVEMSKYDKKVFNKALVMNIGVLLAEREGQKYGIKFDYFVFNDVDTIPIDPTNSYCYSPFAVHRGVYRNFPNRKKFTYTDDNYFGGIVQFSREVFASMNGFGNSYWGWSREDDDSFLRYKIVRDEIGRRRKIKFVYEVNRPGYDDGKVWTFPNSTERKDPRFNTYKKDDYRRQNNKQYELMEVKEFSNKKINVIVMRNNGINQIDGNFDVVHCSINRYNSLYSVKINMNMNETRTMWYKGKYDSLAHILFQSQKLKRTKKMFWKGMDFSFRKKN